MVYSQKIQIVLVLKTLGAAEVQQDKIRNNLRMFLYNLESLEEQIFDRPRQATKPFIQKVTSHYFRLAIEVRDSK